MIYTVTCNPSLDYVVTVPELKEGGVNRSTGETILPGGKGINVAIVLHNLGYDVTALAFSAGFVGKEIERLVEQKGIRTDFIRLEQGNSRINVKIKTKQESEINGTGPEVTEKDIDRLFGKLQMLSDGDLLVLAGSLPASLPKSFYADIMKYLEKRRIRVIVDAEKALLSSCLPYQPFLVKPNTEELGDMFGVVIREKEDARKYAGKLQEQGAKNVLVSMAEKGAVLLTEDGDMYQSEAPSGTVINSVGAGDSMIAGFLAGYIEKHDYKEAFQMGLCAGSASAFSTGLATKEAVAALRSVQK